MQFPALIADNNIVEPSGIAQFLLRFLVHTFTFVEYPLAQWHANKPRFLSFARLGEPTKARTAQLFRLI